MVSNKSTLAAHVWIRSAALEVSGCHNSERNPVNQLNDARTVFPRGNSAHSLLLIFNQFSRGGNVNRFGTRYAHEHDFDLSWGNYREPSLALVVFQTPPEAAM